jgi:hypothetical protein
MSSGSLPATTMEPEPDAAASAPDRDAPVRRSRRRRLPAVGLALLAALPALAAVVVLLGGLGGRYLPYGDQAILELNVRDVGHHTVLLGQYSRFGWYHPGPLAAYLLAVPYHLLAGAHQSLSIGALLIAGSSLAGSVLLIRRRAGTTAAIWSIGVLALSVRLLGPDFLRDSWNPFLPILPLLLTVLLCWCALEGDAWALPLATVTASLAVQSHVGFLPPVAAVAAVTALGLLGRAVHRRRTGSPRSRRRLVALAVTVVVPVLLWLPPLIQQLTTSPGNAGTILRYLRSSTPDTSLGMGLRGVADEFGKLPAYLLGMSPPRRLLLPALFPPSAIVVGIALFLAAVMVGVRRRRGDVLWLAALTVAVAVSGVAAISRIDGPAFFYVTRWTAVIGMLAGITTGVGLIPEVVALLRRLPTARLRLTPELALAGPLALLVVVASLVTTVGTARAQTPQTDYTGGVRSMERAVVADLDRRGIRHDGKGHGPVVRVDFAASTRNQIVGTSFEGSGLVLALVRDGVEVQVSTFWRLPFGHGLTDRVDSARYVATLAYSDGTSPPPAPGQRVLAVAGEYQVYGGPAPTP